MANRKKWRVLVCGGRNWSNKSLIKRFLSIGMKDIECVIEGEARGADYLARLAAEELGIRVLPFPAEWKKYGKRAGSIRNQRMLDEGKPNFVLAFHNDIGNSKGTRDMVKRARKAGILVEIISE